MRLLIILGLMMSATAQAQELDPVFELFNSVGTIVVERLSDQHQWTANPERAAQGFLPASTFKIANSLIILETGVIEDPVSDTIAWDGVERGGSWDQDQSLRSAFRRSAVWAYQSWVREVGHDRMQELVSAMGYGNGDIGAPDSPDLFWLEGPLEISAQEQIDFLGRLYSRDLPFRADVMDRVIEIMEADRGDDWVIRAKTGWAIRDEPNTGWYVGWLETGDDVFFFAMNMELDFAEDDGRNRIRIARYALETVTGLDLSPED
ncbi:penicillin-binding transpeptidase domain-containing protein [Hyphobacterium sp.]|uniref:penicillin-binding transpeptidase domain-containing protein n=1 Tax=Hyphobacterium sp. TaxID=2004662 RepID=UPI00374A508D